MNTTASQHFFSHHAARIVLGIILCLAFFVRVWHLNYNSPFLDEALYILVGQHVWAGTWEGLDPFSWVGGLPFFYPPLTALMYVWGGIVGSRFLNVLLGTAAVYVMHRFAKSLSFAQTEEENEFIGLVAALFMALLTIPIYLSRLANYDMLSFTLFLIAVTYLHLGLNVLEQDPIRAAQYFPLAVIALFASFLAKYVTLSFFPFLVLWVLYRSWRVSHAAVVQAVLYFLVPLAALTGVYGAVYFEELRAFSMNQLGDTTVTVMDVLGIFLRYTWLPLVGGLAALWLAHSRRERLIAVALFAAACVVPVIHIFNQDTAALHQHTFLSIIFLLPLLGYLLTQIVSVHRGLATSSLILSALLIVFISLGQVATLQAEWPNADAAFAYLKTHMSTSETLLSFEDDVAVLALPEVNPMQITGIFDFAYSDLNEVAAYHQAVVEGQFDWILFNEDNTEEVGAAVASVLSERYTEVFADPPLRIYRKQ